MQHQIIPPFNLKGYVETFVENADDGTVFRHPPGCIMMFLKRHSCGERTNSQNSALPSPFRPIHFKSYSIGFVIGQELLDTTVSYARTVVRSTSIPQQATWSLETVCEGAKLFTTPVYNNMNSVSRKEPKNAPTHTLAPAPGQDNVLWGAPFRGTCLYYPDSG
jgi:hypothetical protein